MDSRKRTDDRDLVHQGTTLSSETIQLVEFECTIDVQCSDIIPLIQEFKLGFRIENWAEVTKEFYISLANFDFYH